jgi:hypothetical protein
MAKKRSSSGPAWQAILEDIRSQNRTTLEASTEDRTDIAELKRLGLEDRTDIAELKRLVQERRVDIAELKQIGLQHDVEIRDLKVDVQENTVELRALAAKVDALNRLDERVTALEKRIQ